MRRFSSCFLLGMVVGGIAAVLLLFTIGGITGAAAARYQDLSVFSSVLRLIRDHYVEPVEQKTLLENAVHGMIGSLDPHSSYLDPKAHREMQINTRGEFYGLGIEIIKEREGYVEVVAPIDGTPAARAGLRPRDQITRICPSERPSEWGKPCRTTLGMDLHEAVSLMRGPRGSEIKIYIMRDGFEEVEPFTIKRDVVKVLSVDSRTLEGGFAYFRIRSFQERTADDLKAALARMAGELSMGFSGVVLDLRDNPGGLLTQAVRVADIWLDDGLIVYTEGRTDPRRHEFRARNLGDDQGGYPMVVLINEGSASASEIVAGALQDQQRALVVGVQSFGKGSVQTVYPLEDGSGLRLTTALYYTPSGRSIQEVGIEPDIAVASSAMENEESTNSRVIRERDLKGHLSKPSVNYDSSTEENSDFQLARAVEVLRSWAYFERLREGKSVEKKTASALDMQ